MRPTDSSAVALIVSDIYLTVICETVHYFGEIPTLSTSSDIMQNALSELDVLVKWLLSLKKRLTC